MIVDKHLNFLIRSSRNFPHLSWVYLLSMLRYLNSKNISHFTLARSGFSPASYPKLSPISAQPEKKRSVLVKTQNSNLELEQAIIEIYNKAEGIEIDTLNLLYANRAISINRHSWLIFFNNYIRLRRGWPISLDKYKSDNIFQDLRSTIEVNDKYPDILVSVIMPAYNNADTIGYAANSILNQNHKNIELIIVDDCSSDKTESVCKGIIESDVRVKYFRNEKNSGAYFSRNRGLQVARGHYITVLDADDWSFPQRISYQLEKLMMNKRSKAHLGYYLRLKKDGSLNSFRICSDYSYDGALHKCLASLMIDAGFMKKELGFWDSVRFGADSELYSRILSLLGSEGVIEEEVPLMLALDREGSLTTIENSKLGSDDRMRYAESFSAWHRTHSGERLFMDFPLHNRPFPIPNSMLTDFKLNSPLSDVNKKIKVALFGTSRLHRPFLKRDCGGAVINNITDEIDLKLPNLGYFHTTAEILQAIRWIKNSNIIPLDLRKYVFRVEPRLTTPGNEFNADLEHAIINNLSYQSGFNITDLDALIIEISSLSQHYNESAKVYFHTNPNFTKNIPYSNLEEGFYKKIGMDSDVKKIQADFLQIKSQLLEIKRELPEVRTIIVMGHLRSPNNPNKIRDALHDLLSNACKEAEVYYFDNQEFLEKYGWNKDKANNLDKHHLSHEGEMALGVALQNCLISFLSCNKNI